jgi:hypothetical protein
VSATAKARARVLRKITEDLRKVAIYAFQKGEGVYVAKPLSTLIAELKRKATALENLK